MSDGVFRTVCRVRWRCGFRLCFPKSLLFKPDCHQEFSLHYLTIEKKNIHSSIFLPLSLSLFPYLTPSRSFKATLFSLSLSLFIYFLSLSLSPSLSLSRSHSFSLSHMIILIHMQKSQIYRIFFRISTPQRVLYSL